MCSRGLSFPSPLIYVSSLLCPKVAWNMPSGPVCWKARGITEPLIVNKCWWEKRESLRRVWMKRGSNTSIRQRWVGPCSRLTLYHWAWQMTAITGKVSYGVFHRIQQVIDQDPRIWINKLIFYPVQCIFHTIRYKRHRSLLNTLRFHLLAVY